MFASKIFVVVILLSFKNCINTYTIKSNDVQHVELNNHPIIAVLAQVHDHKNTSYIAASYVKFLESVGARVIPIPTSYSEEKVREIFGYVNGVLFPGGNTIWFKSSYSRNLQIALEYALKGGNFALWGTCLGFQGLNVMVAQKEENVLTHINLVGKVALNFTDDAPSSRLYGGMSKQLYDAMSNEPLTYNHHHDGVTLKNFNSNENLRNFFHVLSTNMDLKGDEFISSFEAYEYPIFGTQWHPEKNNFEFNIYEDIPHTNNAVKASLHVADVFVNEARKNLNKFPSLSDEHKHMIYKYKVTDTQEMQEFIHYEQVYFFN